MIQVPVCRLGNARVVFYCHFPDQLLTQRRSLLKRLYRAPLDWIEEKTTGAAHTILVSSGQNAGTALAFFLAAFAESLTPTPVGPLLHGVQVNSHFTARTFQKTFKTLKVVPDVLYPSLNFAAFDTLDPATDIGALVRT